VYIDEFKLLKQPTQICAITRDILLITFACDINNLKLYTIHGELVKEYSIPHKEKFKNNKDLITSGYWIDNINDSHFVLGNIANMDLYFCFLDSINYEVTLVKEHKFKVNSHNNIIKFRNSNTIDIVGLSPIVHCENYYIVSPRSDMKGLTETFWEMYDIQGEYIGKSNLKDYKAVYKVFSTDGDTLWFKTLDNYEYLYVVKRKRIK